MLDYMSRYAEEPKPTERRARRLGSRTAVDLPLAEETREREAAIHAERTRLRALTEVAS